MERRPTDAPDPVRVSIGSTADLADARRRAGDIAHACLDDQRSSDVVLVTSELLTNALEHGAEPPVDLVISVDDEALTVEVTSRSSEVPEPSSELAPVTEVRGRGLQIVATLSDGLLVTGTDDRVGVAARFLRV